MRVGISILSVVADVSVESRQVTIVSATVFLEEWQGNEHADHGNGIALNTACLFG
jgi:hypothetical protein